MESAASEENIGKGSKMKRDKISVCMACYNGELYIREQIASILDQLEAEDELIIVDDASSDDTAVEIQKCSDSRIRYIRNEQNLGVNRSFEKAITMAKNPYLFMADQDDLWTEGRVDVMLSKLEKGYLLVSGNSDAMDAQGNQSSYDLGTLKSADSDRYGNNIVKIFMGNAYYYGCAMAFRRELKRVILPFPNFIESHDLWIAMAANLAKNNLHLEEIVLKRRIHGKNASVLQRSLRKKLYSRWIFLKSYFILLWRQLKSGI